MAARTDPRLTFRRDAILNTNGSQGQFWTKTFFDPNERELWCEWADPDGIAHPGNIYFTKASDPTIPSVVRDAIPSCDKRDEDRVRRRVEQIKSKALAIGAIIGATALGTITSLVVTDLYKKRKAAKKAAEDTNAPVHDQRVDAYESCGPSTCLGTVRVSVPRHPSATTSVVIDHGDGSAPETYPVAPSPGSTTVISEHNYPGGARYVRRATLQPSGAFSDSVISRPTVSVLAGDNQTTPSGRAFPTPVKVMVRDSAGTPVPGADVFLVPQAGAGSGTFYGTPVAAGADRRLRRRHHGVVGGCGGRDLHRRGDRCRQRRRRAAIHHHHGAALRRWWRFRRWHVRVSWRRYVRGRRRSLS